jgi:hypothetical protein
MFTALAALALAGPAHADCGARALRISDDQPWLVEDVRAVVRTRGAPAAVDRWLVDLGDAGCGPDGTCAPIIEAAWQPRRSTAFFAGTLAAGGPAGDAEVRLELRDGGSVVVPTRSRIGGRANARSQAVPGHELRITHPVLQPQGEQQRVVIRVVGERAGEVEALQLRTAGQKATLARMQLQRVAEGEARAALGTAKRHGPATVQGLDATGAEVCFQEIEAELDLGFQDP